MNGYASSSYAESLAEWGRPVHLPRSGGWVLEQVIPGSDRLDACAVYPLLCCTDWAALKQDLDDFAQRWVSVVSVCDPLAMVSSEDLKHIFNGPVRPFKDHFLVDLRNDPSARVNPSHRRRQRRAAQNMLVEEVQNPEEALDDWVRLYSNLVGRHNIQGLRQFSTKSFALQFRAPGLSVWRASVDGETVSMALWYLHQKRAYYHLGASSACGYRWGASYAIFGAAIAEFQSRGIHLLNLGGGHGLSRRPDDGLERFKRGWSSSSCTAYLCGRIFDPVAYAVLTAKAEPGPADYFPAYRGAEALATHQQQESTGNDKPVH